MSKRGDKNEDGVHKRKNTDCISQNGIAEDQGSF